MAQPKAIIGGDDRTSAGDADSGGENGPLIGSESPLQQGTAIAHNELDLSGWAVSPNGIRAVVVQIGAERTFQASYGLDSRHLTEAMPEMPQADRAGYRLQVDTSDWKAGVYPVRVEAVDGAGNRREIAGSVEVLPFEEPRYTVEDNLAVLAEGGLAMWLEEPRVMEGARVVEAPVTVSGWAYASSGVRRVVVSIDGRLCGEASRPHSRADLFLDYGAEVAGEAGFVLELSEEEVLPGGHAISVVAVSNDGHAVGIGGRIARYWKPARPEPFTDGRPAEVEWLEQRVVPRLRERGADGVNEVDEAFDRVEAMARLLRYRWAAALAAGKRVLDVGGEAEEAATLLAGAAEAVRVGAGELGGLPFPDDSFDFVTCFGPLGSAAAPERALEELRRVLRDDGALLISIPGPELQRLLRERFERVRTYRQRTGLASAIFAEGSAVASPSLHDLLIALASGAELPALPALEIAADPGTLERMHEVALEWEGRALHAEAEAELSRREARLAQAHQTGAASSLRAAEEELARASAERRRLTELEGSLSWRLTAPLRRLRRRVGGA